MMRRSVKIKKSQALPLLFCLSLLAVGMAFSDDSSEAGRKGKARGAPLKSAGGSKRAETGKRAGQNTALPQTESKKSRLAGWNFFKTGPKLRSSQPLLKKGKKRVLSSQSHPPTDRFWARALVFEDGREALYYLRANPDLIVSLREEEGFSPKGAPEDFFKKLEAEKQILFQSLSLKARKLDFSEIKKEKGLMVFRSKGSYKDFQNRRSLFEDWSFYHSRLIIHFVASFRHPPGPEEEKALKLLFESFVLSREQLSKEDKARFLDLFNEARKAGG